jgi:hypothetical protein
MVLLESVFNFMATVMLEKRVFYSFGMFVKIVNYWKIIAILEDNWWLPKY